MDYFKQHSGIFTTEASGNTDEGWLVHYTEDTIEAAFKLQAINYNPKQKVADYRTQDDYDYDILALSTDEH